MTPEERSRCRCPAILCPVHPTKETDRHVGPCHCIQCRPDEWRDPKPKKETLGYRVMNPKWTRPAWLQEMTHGLSEGHLWGVVFEGEHWALVHQPGSKYWAGLGMQAYGRTKWVIYRKTNKAWARVGRHVTDLNVTPRPKQWLYEHPEFATERGIAAFEVHTGRMNKRLLEHLKAEVSALDKHRP
jgi:hypothetical protein